MIIGDINGGSFQLLKHCILKNINPTGVELRELINKIKAIRNIVEFNTPYGSKALEVFLGYQPVNKVIYVLEERERKYFVAYTYDAIRIGFAEIELW